MLKIASRFFLLSLQAAWIMNVVAMGVMIGDRGFTPVANLSSGDIPPTSYRWHPLFGLLAFCFMFVQPFVAFVRQAIVLFTQNQRMFVF